MVGKYSFDKETDKFASVYHLLYSVIRDVDAFLLGSDFDCTYNVYIPDLVMGYNIFLPIKFFPSILRTRSFSIGL
jgi:hypothetical protein